MSAAALQQLMGLLSQKCLYRSEPTADYLRLTTPDGAAYLITQDRRLVFDGRSGQMVVQTDLEPGWYSQEGTLIAEAPSCFPSGCNIERLLEAADRAQYNQVSIRLADLVSWLENVGDEILQLCGPYAFFGSKLRVLAEEESYLQASNGAPAFEHFALRAPHAAVAARYLLSMGHAEALLGYSPNGTTVLVCPGAAISVDCGGILTDEVTQAAADLLESLVVDVYRRVAAAPVPRRWLNLFTADGQTRIGYVTEQERRAAQDAFRFWWQHPLLQWATQGLMEARGVRIRYWFDQANNLYFPGAVLSELANRPEPEAGAEEYDGPAVQELRSRISNVKVAGIIAKVPRTHTLPELKASWEPQRLRIEAQLAQKEAAIRRQRQLMAEVSEAAV